MPTTYPIPVEQMLHSSNWPAEVNVLLAQQKAENVKLEECNAWLENGVRSLRAELDLLKAQVSGIGRRLGRLAGLVEERGKE